MNDHQQMTESSATANGYPDWDIESVVEQIRSDLGGAITRPTIRQEIAIVTPAFKYARVTTSVPLFVRKRTVERLRAGASRVAPKGLA